MIILTFLFGFVSYAFAQFSNAPSSSPTLSPIKYVSPPVKDQISVVALVAILVGITMFIFILLRWLERNYFLIRTYI
jgi:hypothetical protein